MPQAHYSREEIARRGQALYDQQIRLQVEAGNRGKFLVVDITTGDYEIDADELTALQRARTKNQDALLYLLRIGYPTAYTIGGNVRTVQP